MQVWNIGSINRDHVYRVERLAAPGETLSARGYAVGAGGKGYNQSIALARAGVPVAHLGHVGEDARPQVLALRQEGIDCRHLRISDRPSGHAIIQVADSGENCILVHAGANSCIAPADIDAALAEARPTDVVLLQNETSAVAHAISTAHARGLPVVFNPAPMDRQVPAYPLQLVDLLILNQTEAQALCGCSDVDRALVALRQLCPQAAVVLTLGGDGALFADDRQRLEQPAFPTQVVDTTAAGDSFIGFFLASWLRRRDPRQALIQGCRAAALCVARPGAAVSIPLAVEVAGATP